MEPDDEIVLDVLASLIADYPGTEKRQCDEDRQGYVVQKKDPATGAVVFVTIGGSWRRDSGVSLKAFLLKGDLKSGVT